MRSLDQSIRSLAARVDALLDDRQAASRCAMPGNAFFLDSGDVLALPRDNGDSRYPYGHGGFSLWACASGYLYANEGLFSLFLRSAEGQEPRAAFFAGFPREGGFLPVPLLGVPLMEGGGGEAVERATVLAPAAAYYLCRAGGLLFGVRVFVTEAREICFSLHAENPSPAARSLFVSPYLNPYLRHQIYESGEDRWFKEVRHCPPANGGAGLGHFLLAVNEDKDRHHSITNWAAIVCGTRCAGGARLATAEATTSRNQYVGGTRSSLATPAALYHGTFGEGRPVCTFTENAIAGAILRLDLPSASAFRLDMVLGCSRDRAEALTRMEAGLDPERIDRACEEGEERDRANHSALRARWDQPRDQRLKPAVMNPFLEHLKRQVEFCSLLKGYVQLSENSLIGIRDVFQALEGLLFWRPEAARAKMIEALGFTTPDGRCFRQYSLPSSAGAIGRMDLRPFIDQGCWVISCVATYLRMTGDVGFLGETCGYHVIVDEAGRKVEASDQRDTVLDHLLRIMAFLLSNRAADTGCIRALYGDWNDALDGLGISSDPAEPYGSGVSVMASLQVYANLAEMAEILRATGDDRHNPVIRRYQEARAELGRNLRRHAVVSGADGKRRIVHGWGDRRGYLVGSFRDPDGCARDGLTSNAFWVLSGLDAEDRSLQPDILRALERLDSKYGYKTFEPFFEPDTPGVGRIGKLPPGTAENGAVYVHATVFAIMALFRMGRAREGWEQLVKILPFTDLHGNLSHSPFVMPNAYGFNPGKFIDGENMNDWQTGSSNVLLKLLIRYVFGFEPAPDGFWVQPAAWSPFGGFDFHIRFRGREVRLRYSDSGSGRRAFRVNGREMPGQRDAEMSLDKLWVGCADLPPGAVDIAVSD